MRHQRLNASSGQLFSLLILIITKTIFSEKDEDIYYFYAEYLFYFHAKFVRISKPEVRPYNILNNTR